MIISKINPDEKVSFCVIPHDEILRQIENLDTEKAIQ